MQTLLWANMTLVKHHICVTFLSQKFSYAFFRFFRICHPFLSKCMLRMQKRTKSNMIREFFMTDESFGGSV